MKGNPGWREWDLLYSMNYIYSNILTAQMCFLVSINWPVSV